MSHKVLTVLLLLVLIHESKIICNAYVKRYDGYSVMRIIPKTLSELQYLYKLSMSDHEV